MYSTFSAQTCVSLVFTFILCTAVVAINAEVPPPVFRENWRDHNQTLARMYIDDEVSFYFAPDVNKTITWPFVPLSKTWKHVKETYGSIGEDPHLYVVLHGRQTHGCVAMEFEYNDNRNLIDCGGEETLGWEVDDSFSLEMLLTNVVYIIRYAMHGHRHASDVNVSGYEILHILNYDLLLNLEWNKNKEDVARWMQDILDERETNGVVWFRDWFLPIYEKYGGSSVLSKYYKVQKKWRIENGEDSRLMNHGEFVHVWSEAAGTDLEYLIKKAEKWTLQYENELIEARIDYPRFSYLVNDGSSSSASIHFHGQTAFIGSITIGSFILAVKYLN